MTGGRGQVSVSMRFAGQLLPANAAAAATAVANDGLVQTLVYGTGSGQVDILVYQILPSLSAGASATYDLYTGTDLKDIFGDTAPFRKVKAIAVWVDSGGDASGVRVGGAASNVWAGFFADTSDKALIFPSGVPYLGGSPAGVAVGSSTKNLKVENAGAVAAVVGIWIAGTSA